MSLLIILRSYPRAPRGNGDWRVGGLGCPRLPAPWRSGYAAACKAVHTGSIPVGALLSAVAAVMLPSPQKKESHVQATSIQIHRGEPGGQYEVLGEVKAKKGALTPFNARPSEDEVNEKLRHKAEKMGADAIINVDYQAGVIPSSWKGMTATGTAVKMTA